MQRRGGSEQPVKGQSANRPEACNAPTAQVSTDHSQGQLERLARERDEALEREAATAEVLKVISRSTFDLKAVLETLVQSAGKLCQAENVQIFLRDGEFYQLAADNGFSPEYQQYVREHPIRPGRGTLVARTALGVVPVQIPDRLADSEYTYHEGGNLGGYRTMLGVPLVRDGNCIGVIALTRSKVRPFTDKQIELVQNFAAQAVIAIENTRLLNELRQRTDALSESLDRQTAMSEVLGVISSSPTDLTPVFDTILANATRLCEGNLAALWRYDGEFLVGAAQYNASAAFVEHYMGTKLEPGRSGPARLAALECRTVHVADITTEPGFSPMVLQYERARTVLAVPLLREKDLVGVIAIWRREVRPFTEQQIALVRTFADQAVIAIENARLLNELRESLQQQTATSEVLKIISSSPGELEPVFEAMLENAVRICGAKFGSLVLFEGNAYRRVALHNGPPAYVEARARDPVRPLAASPTLSRVAATKQVVQVADMAVEQPEEGIVRLGGARTVLAVPMLNDDRVVGVITMYRQEVRPFTDKQTELVKNFAAQAVIAIENTRLLSELRQRTDDLSESLEQQTATSEVLKVISSSPGELEPVFNAMLANATHVCHAEFGTLYLRETDAFRAVAIHNAPPAYVQARKGDLVRPPPDSALGQVLTTHQVAQIDDITTTKSYVERNPYIISAVELGGYRTIAAVPMLKDDELVGAILIYRQEVRSFSEKQIALLRNFADQAVIAIENTRLLSELRKSLQQQTATADVLKVISRSTFDLQIVLNTLVESACGLCDAEASTIWRPDGDAFKLAANFGQSAAHVDAMRQLSTRPGRESCTGRVLLEGRTIHIQDCEADPEYKVLDVLRVTGNRAILGVPLLREGVPIGVFTLTRSKPFTEKQIELATTFADQAVIAIENVRLFDEVQQRTRELSEALEQQTATSEVLKVISSSPGELEPVFNAMLANATRICEATFGRLWLFEGNAFRAVAIHSTQTFADYQRRNPVLELRDHPGIPLDRIAKTKQVVHIPDFRADQSYIGKDSAIVTLVETEGTRSFVAVPMLKEGELIGAIAIYRQEIRPFTDKQIELVSNFAAQAVIAIENTRLLSELRESLQQQTATADVLKVISRSTFDLRAVLQTLVESAARLCDADKAIITRQKEGVFYRAEAYGFSREFMDQVRDTPIKAERGSGIGRALLEGRVIHIPDVKADPEFTFMEHQKLGDFRTVLAVPMLREGVPRGIVTLTRSEVRPFTDKQIELATTFADQAAIAIENVRLFESVEARTRELAASLENLQTTQDRLVQTQKLASLGQLTAGIAHEIKNPLNFVNNFSVVSAELIDELQDILKRVSVDDKTGAEIKELTATLQGNLDKVVQHGKRADAIVKNMLLHSREGSGEHRPVDINTLVEESLNLAYHGARAEKQGFTITLERSLDPAAGAADIFPQDITRALLNLISNGFYAATKRKAEANGGDYEPTLTAATKNLGDRVEIRIRDNGMGIPPEVKEKMFNPFFTTKPAGEGTGLGLSISHDIIVKQHGGSIEVDTQPGEFTELRVILPRAAVFQATAP